MIHSLPMNEEGMRKNSNIHFEVTGAKTDTIAISLYFFFCSSDSGEQVMMDGHAHLEVLLNLRVRFK